MSSYIENNLNKDEKILYKANLHWLIFFNKLVTFGLLFLILGIVITSIGGQGNISFTISGILISVGLIYAIEAKLSTELVITNSRVVSKTGFIARKTYELKVDKVESVNVEQGILDRIFGCGTILVNGTGAGITPIKNISNPLEFRNNVNRVIDEIGK